MNITGTPSSERPHIAFFGMRNAGKSSLVNAVTSQKLSIVSESLGTTTDPVSKAMEILPLGPVVIIDTPGFDDEGSLGKMRVDKAKEVLRRTDIAVLVVDAVKGLQSCDNELINIFKKNDIPYITAFNKADIAEKIISPAGEFIPVSSKTGEGINELKEKIGHILEDGKERKYIIRDLIKPGDLVILVIPIDESAPKDRLILPQQMVLRECLDANAAALLVQPDELRMLLDSLNKRPALVITDSQAFAQVSADTPDDIPLTSFSILMARYRGFLETSVKGIFHINNLQSGSRILIAEGCTHHRQCGDIGTVKLPKLIKKSTTRNLIFDTCSGREFPSNLKEYDLIIHCGGCMITETEMLNRMKEAVSEGVPFTNYGIALAYLNGILDRSLEFLPKIL